MKKAKPESINVAVRRDKRTRQPVVFFINQSARGWWLECYTRREQHAQCSREYMRQSCQPVNHTEDANPDVAALLAEWEKQPPGPVIALVVSRLTAPRNLSYIGY